VSGPALESRVELKRPAASCARSDRVVCSPLLVGRLGCHAFTNKLTGTHDVSLKGG